MEKGLAIHGGKRVGAGRPPTLAKQLEEARVLAKKINIGLKLGADKLSDVYASLMDLAIQKARGDFDGGRPDSKTIMMLLELLPKFSHLEKEEGDTPVTQILKSLRSNVTNIQVNEYTKPADMGNDSKGYSVEVEGNNSPRMGESITVPS